MMAMLSTKASFLRTICVKNWLGAAKPNAAHLNKLTVAPLTLTHGEKYPYTKKPWDYENRIFTPFHDIYDRSLPRICENSKVIIVEGNIGAGKHDFAERLAKQFDMKFIRAPTDYDCFTYASPAKADFRLLDPCMPENSQIYDVKKFLTDPNPEKGRAGFLQKEFLRQKHHFYCRALLHLLSSGQGVVIVRTPYGDPVFTKALCNAGFVSGAWKEFYDNLHKNTICDLLTPHLTIYLDVAVETAMERINGRNNESEVGHKNLERLVGSMDDVYRDGEWLTKMAKTGQVMELDWNEQGDDLDIDVIGHEISHLRLDCHGVDDPLFQDWSRWNFTDNEVAVYRQFYQSDAYVDHYFSVMVPGPECSETYFNIYQNVYDRLPIIARHPAFNKNYSAIKELGNNSDWKLF